MRNLIKIATLQLGIAFCKIATTQPQAFRQILPDKNLIGLVCFTNDHGKILASDRDKRMKKSVLKRRNNQLERMLKRMRHKKQNRRALK